MLFDLMTTGMKLIYGTLPWWAGVPVTLVRKTPLVTAAADRLPVYTLTFAMPQELIIPTNGGKAKPHADIDLDLGDVVKMVIPGYKPKSYSVSALRRTEFDVTFKVYPNGRASGYLDRLQIGDTINSFGMSAGRVRNSGDFVGIVTYGVGITEGLPVAVAELERCDATRVTLLWASRTWQDTFWHDEISTLQRRYGKRLQVVHILSRQQRDGCLHGRINANVLDKVFQPANRNEARFLSVGTKEMMRLTDDMLASIQYPMPGHALLPSGTKSRK